MGVTTSGTGGKVEPAAGPGQEEEIPQPAPFKPPDSAFQPTLVAPAGVSESGSSPIPATVQSDIPDKEGIMDSIRDFLGTGK